MDSNQQMPVSSNPAHGTPGWWSERRYKFTSSCVHKLMTEPRSNADKAAGKLSETAKNYIMEKVAEEMGGFIPDVSVRAMEWGNENEPLAIEWYQKQSGNAVEPCGFLTVHEFYGGTPDSRVFDPVLSQYGALEVKCPYNSTKHLWHCLIKSGDIMKEDHKDKYWQCVSHLLTMDRPEDGYLTPWCDFVSFDPRIDHEIGYHCFRLYRPDEDCEKLKRVLERALEYKLELREKLGILGVPIVNPFYKPDLNTSEEEEEGEE